MILPIGVEDTFGCHTRPYNVGTSELEMPVLAEELPALATDDKQTSTSTSTSKEEDVDCQEKSTGNSTKLDAADGQAVDADGKDGEPPRRVSKDDFQLLKVIGMGAFGKVLQASDSVMVVYLYISGALRHKVVTAMHIPRFLPMPAIGLETDRA